MPTGFFRAVAHRGASAYAPENTIAAFREALRLGAKAVEFDVRLSADGVPVILHDDTLERTTSGHGPVAQWRVADLQQLDAGRWFGERFAGERVPTLDETLAILVPAARPVIELKAPLTPQQLLPVLDRHGVGRSALVISFAPEWLSPLREARPDLPLGVLGDAWTPDLLQACRRLEAAALVLNVQAMSLDRITMATNAGLEFWCYTVNDSATVAACGALGVAGVITDKPDLIRIKQRP